MFINTVSFILWTSCPVGTRTDVTGSLCVSQEHCVIFSPLSNSSPVNTALKSGVNKRLLKGMPFKKKKRNVTVKSGEIQKHVAVCTYVIMRSAQKLKKSPG